MAAAEDILRNFNLFIDGIGYAGNVESFTPPNLSLATEEFKAAGMIAPLEVETGMLEKLEASFTLTKIAPEVEARVGNWLKPISLTARGALQDFDGNVKECVVKLTGKIKSIESGEWKPGEKLPAFDRLAGLKEGAPIHENYDTHTGARLKAPHFSWSAVHLLLLYEEYGK